MCVFPIVSVLRLSAATILIQSAQKPNAFNPPSNSGFKIGPLASEIFVVENVDGRRRTTTNDGCLSIQ